MIPTFLRPEVVPFASVEILHARLTDAAPVVVALPYLLYVRYPNRSIQILRFPTAFARGLVCITLGPLPVDLRIEDPVVAA